MRKLMLALVLVLILVGGVYAQSRFQKQYNLSVNPYTATTLTETSVGGYSVYSPTINFKLSVDGTNYIPMDAGGAFNFSDLNMTTLTIKVQGNTATDTGTVYVIINKR